MAYQSDFNGMYIEGMTSPDELGDYLKLKFTEQGIQDAYTRLLEESKAVAHEEGVTPLKGFWKLLDRSYKHVPPLKCGRGCAHCCHTGVAATQLEWEGMVEHARAMGIDLNQVIERSRKSVDRVRDVVKSNRDLSQIDWHRLVINQPCPFLDEEQACMVYEDRPLDCRLVVAFRDACTSKKLEHAQRGVVIEEAVGSTIIARLQHDQTPKFKRRAFRGTQPLRLLQHWLVLWQEKNKKKKK